MDDINSTLEKIVKLDKDASKLDRDLLKHNSNFSEMHYNMGLAKPNPVSAKLLKKDVTLLSKKVKLLQRKLKKDDTNFAYQELFLRNAQYFLTARLAFNDFFYNPNSRIRPRTLLSILFEHPYKTVLDTQNNPDRFYRLDHTRLRLSQKFSANLFSPNERETIKIAEELVPSIKNFLISLSRDYGLLQKTEKFDFEMVLEKEDGFSSWENGTLSLDINSLVFCRDNGKLDLYLVKALRDSSHELLGHAIHQKNSEMLSESLKPCDKNEYGFVQKVLSEGIGNYWENKVINHIRRSQKKIKIEVPEHVSQKLKTKNNDKTRYLQIDPDNLMELYLATKLHIFWNAQDIIEHTNRMEEPLSRERIKTYAETHNFCLVRDVFYKNSRYSQRIFDEAPVVFGAPYYRKVVSKAVREYGIPLKLAEKVTSIGSWSTKTHYHFVELLLESMGYEKKVQDRTQKSI